MARRNVLSLGRARPGTPRPVEAHANVSSGRPDPEMTLRGKSPAALDAVAVGTELEDIVAGLEVRRQAAGSWLGPQST